jgi:hypothetical protein
MTIPSTKKTVRRALVVLTFLTLCGYVGFQSKDLIAGPVLMVEEPVNGSTVYSDKIEITGQAQNISYIYLNGRQIFTNTEGQFRETLILKPGYSIINLSAKDKFGRETQKIVHIVRDVDISIEETIALSTTTINNSY